MSDRQEKERLTAKIYHRYIYIYIEDYREI